MIEVTRAGWCDLVMDQGRPGYGALGVPAGGAADPAALVAANRLVGNADDAAGLEITLSGPALRFPAGGVVALAGALFDAKRSSGISVCWHETLVMAAGEVLHLGAAISGCRCWLALAGGVTVPAVLESASTFLPGGFGGLQGRRLRSGDVVPVGPFAVVPLRRASPPPRLSVAIRVVTGPQIGWFGDTALAVFFSQSYQVAAASDRRGLRLRGTALKHSLLDLPSQGVLPGAIQVPPEGQPIILGWDGPVTGGYPVIAGVVSVDLPRLAQLRPGDSVRFETMDGETARCLASAAWMVEEIA